MDANVTVLDTMEELAALSSRGLRVRSERCVCVRNRHASCARCAQACTSGALSISSEGTLRVESERCVECGTCATVCPTGALEAQHPNDADLLARARLAVRACGGEAAVFACRFALEAAYAEGALAEARRVVDLACLSRVEESLLASLFADGVKKAVLVHGDCAACPRQPGWESACLVAETMRVLVDAWGGGFAIEMVQELPSFVANGPSEPSIALSMPAPPVADGGAPQGLVSSRTALQHVMADGTLPHFVPTRRVRLLDQMGRLGDPHAGRIECRLWGHVVVDASRCCSCRMCAVFCPTGALCLFSDEDGVSGIEHYAAECVHCCLCQDICPEGAISCEASVDALQLAHGEVERYPLPEPEWRTGPDQILRRMRPQIGGNEVSHSY